MTKKEMLVHLKEKIEIANILKADSATMALLVLDEVEKLGMCPPGMFIDMVRGKPLMKHEWEKE